MRAAILSAALALGLIAATQATAAPITGDINFTGSDSYDATAITFVGSQSVTSGTGTLANVGTCNSCVTAQNLTYSPYAGSLTNFLNVTNNGVTFSLDLGTLSNVSFTPNVSLDIEAAAVLHETGFDDTAGTAFISTQGPNGIEVSFSATALAVPEPASLFVLGTGFLALGMLRFRRLS